MKKTTIDVRIRLIEDQLGTVPKDKEIYTKYIASKAPAEKAVQVAQEVESVVEPKEGEEPATGWTGFMEDEQGLFMFNYMLLGFLRDAGSTLKEQITNKEGKTGIKQLKSKLENNVFVFPRKVRFERNGQFLTEPDSTLERPLRAMTAQGPRVTLAKSDTINAGTEISFRIEMLDHKEIGTETLKEILEFGQMRGLGQFRNGSYGQFELVDFNVRTA